MKEQKSLYSLTCIDCLCETGRMVGIEIKIPRDLNIFEFLEVLERVQLLEDKILLWAAYERQKKE